MRAIPRDRERGMQTLPGIVAAVCLAIGLCSPFVSGAAAGPWPDSTISFGVRLNSYPVGVSTHAAGVTPSFQVGPLALSLVSHAAMTSGTSDSRTWRVQAGARAALIHSRGTAWLAVGGERWTHEEYTSKSPTFELGGDLEQHGFLVMARAQLRTVVVPRSPVLFYESMFDSTPEWQSRDPDRVAVTSFEVGARWSRSAWVVEAGSGLGLGRGVSPVWQTRFHTTRWLMPGLGVTLGGTGAAPGWFADEFAKRARVQLGMVVEPGRSMSGATAIPARTAPRGPVWDVVRLRSNLHAFRVRMPGVERVAMRGDFTSWEPVMLRRAGIGWWEATLQVGRGPHQMEMSVDGGGWRPPLGLATTVGEYGGEVGTFVAE